MTSAKTKRPSLETLIENEDLGLESLHPGGLDTTQELARLCQIGKDTSVLEVASGTGESACYLSASLEARVVGIERSDFMIERARQKAKPRNLEIEFEQADAHQLPFGEAAFERVLSECTTCLLDKERAIREMVRVVKPGGYVGIHDICWQPDTPSKMKKRLAETEEESPETLEGWKLLFEKAGLVEIETVDKSFLIPTWIKDSKKKLGFKGQLKLWLKIVRRWGIRGLRNIWSSERIFQSQYTGYGIIVGRKPSTN